MSWEITFVPKVEFVPPDLAVATKGVHFSTHPQNVIPSITVKARERLKHRSMLPENVFSWMVLVQGTKVSFILMFESTVVAPVIGRLKNLAVPVSRGCEARL